MIIQYKRTTNDSNVIFSGIPSKICAGHRPEPIIYYGLFTAGKKEPSSSIIEVTFHRDAFLYQAHGDRVNSVGAARFRRPLCDQVCQQII